MNIKITNFEIDNRTRDYLNKRLDNLRKFVDLESPNTKLDIEIGRTTGHHQKGDIFKTEFNLSISGEFYRVEEKSEDILSSIDASTEELSRQLRRNKGKKETLFRKGGRKMKELLRRFNYNKE
ncbi:MAG TPA: ribosome-associated translation inhibitor RaiA [Candidatus Paceibacterota bacterium]|jgi:ribosomal subunit interface protein|nr:ribosomal subunit interface protein [Parcubacteria group bacterium]MDP6119629.1 ribosome-associated translation inhibitor RaiA [Candidatus Paceibacterota bacterium]HJN62631.1 ribosome-associated translation inhibitor RaiA [Candidatus Paceibacterota bacterium]|tara:strand:+ start:95 stop:463 length:369 start_codon:yes stop_codon:yes gene_type:complete